LPAEFYRVIPLDIQPETVRVALSSGLGYYWYLLSNLTKDIHYGETQNTKFPKIRMIGRQIIIELIDEVYLDQIDRILSVFKTVGRGV
jgi:hypothetical protein